MTRPLLLDLFCGAGGAAVGYHRAGFDVVGVDIKPQPHYPFEFHQTDWRSYMETLPRFFLSDISVIHASPPCQAYSQANKLHAKWHIGLIAQVRELLTSTGKPYVIENVPGAPLDPAVTVCGRGLGLSVKRHRLFESNLPLMGAPCQGHDDYITVFGHSTERRGNKRVPMKVADARKAMGIDWMNRDEMAQSIPPAYSEFIGSQLLDHLNRKVTA